MAFNLSDEGKRGIIVIAIAIILFIYSRACIRENQSEEYNEEFETKIEVDTLRITQFDPNTVELAELLGFGLSKYEALSIIQYRSAGKVFNIKEELIGCYAISDSLYFVLEPYIVIGDEFKYKPKEYATKYKTNSSQKSYRQENKIEISKFLVDTVQTKYLVAIGALTPRQAEVFVKWRNMSGIHSMQDLRDCYVVSDECAEKLEQYVVFTPRVVEETKSWEREPVDLNKAEIAELISVYGIGEKSALAIVDYREKLGGFYSFEQLSEIKIITEGNYEKIIQQIIVDSCDISKIDVNFAPAKELSGHPYIEDRRLRKLLKIRQLKGGWRTLEEMIEDDIFTEQEADKVRPYLQFEQLGDFSER